MSTDLIHKVALKQHNIEYLRREYCTYQGLCPWRLPNLAIPGRGKNSATKKVETTLTTLLSQDQQGSGAKFAIANQTSRHSTAQDDSRNPVSLAEADGQRTSDVA